MMPKKQVYQHFNTRSGAETDQARRAGMAGREEESSFARYDSGQTRFSKEESSIKGMQ